MKRTIIDASQLELNDRVVAIKRVSKTVKGPKGTLERVLPEELTIKEEDGHVVVSRPNDLKRMKSLHGLTRTLINNMIIGVTNGYEKVLEVNGVGYRAA